MCVTLLEVVTVVLNNEEKFIFASYLYYELAISPMSDFDYDKLAKALLDQYETTQSWFRERVTKEDLEAGTGHMLHYSEEEMKRAEDWADKLGIF